MILIHRSEAILKRNGFCQIFRKWLWLMYWQHSNDADSLLRVIFHLVYLGVLPAYVVSRHLCRNKLLHKGLTTPCALCFVFRWVCRVFFDLNPAVQPSSGHLKGFPLTPHNSWCLMHILELRTSNKPMSSQTDFVSLCMNSTKQQTNNKTHQQL